MAYKVEIRPAALRDLKRIPRADLPRLARAIDALAQDPRPEGVTKLRGAQDLYRIRVGDYRIIYRIRDRVVTVTVIRVRHRRDVYRGM